MSDKRLGRGIESLISPEPVSKSSKPGVAKIFLKNITPNPHQPRRYFDKHALDELVASIKVKGVLTPITVRETKIGYELIAGERRWRAASYVEKNSGVCYRYKNRFRDDGSSPDREYSA